MRKATVVSRMLQGQGKPVAYLRRLRDRLDVIVNRIHDLRSVGTGTVPPQLFELQTFSVFPTHIH